MPQDNAALAATSTATTSRTEPEVVAGISSAEGGPDLPTEFRIAGNPLGPWSMALLLVAGIAIGYGATRWLRADRG